MQTFDSDKLETGLPTKNETLIVSTQKFFKSDVLNLNVKFIACPPPPLNRKTGPVMITIIFIEP